CMKKAMNEEIPFGFQPAEIIEVTGSDAVFGKQRYERTKRRVLKVLVLRQQLLPPGRVFAKNARYFHPVANQHRSDDRIFKQSARNKRRANLIAVPRSHQIEIGKVLDLAAQCRGREVVLHALQPSGRARRFALSPCVAVEMSGSKRPSNSSPRRS